MADVVYMTHTGVSGTYAAVAGQVDYLVTLGWVVVSGGGGGGVAAIPFTSDNTALTGAAVGKVLAVDSLSPTHFALVTPSGGGGGGGAATLTPRSVSANATAASGDLLLVNAAAGPVTITLPAAAGALLEVKKIDPSANIVTILAVGADTIGSVGATSIPLRLGDEAKLLQGVTGNWILALGHMSVASLDARYAVDSALVHNTGTETVAGVKTFSASPVVPTATTAGQAANLGNVTTAVTALVNAAPGALDTLGEIAAQLASDESVEAALMTTVGGNTTAIALKLAKASNLSDLASPSAARTNLGLAAVAASALAADLKLAPPIPGTPAVVGGYMNGVNTPARTTTGTSRVPYTIGVSGSNVRLVFNNWQVTAGYLDSDNTAAIAIKASVLVGGVNYPVTFGGKLTATIDGGGWVCSDPLSIDVTAGQVLQVLTFITPTTNWYHNRYSYAPSGGGGWTVTSDLTPVGSAAVADSYPTPLFGPAFVTVEPTGASKISAIVIGDSIAHGYNDGVNNSGNQGVNTVDTNLSGGGFVGRAFTGVGGLINVAVSGDSIGSMRTASGHFRRLSFAQCAPVAICQYGRNDLSGGSTLAQLQANNIWLWTLCASRGQRAYQTTLTPRTTSTDGWVTTGNQTPTSSAQDTIRVGFNTWLRAGAPMSAGAAVAVGTGGALLAGQAGHPLTGFIEVADAVESARNSNLWKAMANSRTVADGAATGGGGNITSATAAFVAGDRGRRVLLAGAGAAGALYTGTIIQVNNATSIAMSPNPTTTVSAASLTLGDSYTGDGLHPDAYGAIQAAASITPSAL